MHSSVSEWINQWMNAMFSNYKQVSANTPMRTSLHICPLGHSTSTLVFIITLLYCNVVDECNQILGTYPGWKSSLFGYFFIFGRILQGGWWGGTRQKTTNWKGKELPPNFTLDWLSRQTNFLFTKSPIINRYFYVLELKLLLFGI